MVAGACAANPACDAAVVMTGQAIINAAALGLSICLIDGSEDDSGYDAEDSGNRLPGDPDDDPGCIQRMLDQGWPVDMAYQLCRGSTDSETQKESDPNIEKNISDAWENAKSNSEKTMEVFEIIIKALFSGF